MPAEALVTGTYDASSQGSEHAAVATLEPLPEATATPEESYATITWTDTWATPEADATDGQSWHWQEPSFDDEISDVLIARPRRSLRASLLHAMPFSLRERTWSGLGAWRRHMGILVTFAVICVLAVAGGILGYQQTIQAAENLGLSLPSQNSSPTAPSGVIIAPPVAQSTTPTPATPVYQIGTWVSNNTPSSGGTVTVYVRVVQNMQGAPGIPVTVSVQSPGSSKNYGPTRTDSSGIAKFTVRYGSASGSDPVFVTATANVGGQALSAQTTFVPVSGSTQASGTPTSDGNSSSDPPKHHHKR